MLCLLKSQGKPIGGKNHRSKKATLSKKDSFSNVGSETYFANPIASLVFSPDSVCGNTSILFDAIGSTGDNLKYDWDFGDNTTGSGIATSHSFSPVVGGGITLFNVTLKITDKNGLTDTETRTVSVFQLPDVSLINDQANADTTTFNGFITFCKTEALAKYSFIFINNSSTTPSNNRYIFIWGDGTKNDTLTTWNFGQSVLHEYPTGNSILTLSIEGKNGCSSSTQYNVFLGKNEGSSFGPVDNETDYCVGQAKYFKIIPGFNNPPGTIYRLHVNDCSVDSVFYDLIGGKDYIIPHYFNTPQCENACSFVSSYTATLEVINPCKRFSISTFDLNVRGKSKAGIQGDTIGCVNSEFIFTNHSDFGSVYENGICKKSGVQVWTVTPDSTVIFNIADAGKLGGNHSDWMSWTSGTNQFKVKFTRPGFYKIKLYISNRKCTDADSAEITVCIRDIPKAIFTLDTSNFKCSEGTLVVNNLSGRSSECSGDVFRWHFDYLNDNPECSRVDTTYLQGTSDTSYNPKVHFNAAGRYSIYLTTAALDAGNHCPTANSDRDTLTIKAKPIVNIVQNSFSICVGNSIVPVPNVSNCYTDTVKYFWDFQRTSNDISSLKNPGQIAYDSVGTFSIKLKAGDSSTCGFTEDSATVNVFDKPGANAGSNAAVCSGDTVTIGTPGIAGLQYSWFPATNLNNADLAQPTAVLLYDGPKNDTIFKFALTVSAGVQCDSTDSVEITVRKGPKLAVSPNAATLCRGDSVILSASGADLYQWLPVDSVKFLSSNSVAISPKASGVYTVTGTSNGCSSNQQIPITVTAAAVADAGPDTSVCNGSSVIIGANTGNFSYSWFPSKDLSDPNSATPTLTPSGYTNNTTITYYITSMANARCIATDSVNINIKGTNPITISPQNPAICAGESITITATGADSFIWNPDSIQGNTVVLSPTDTTQYEVTGTFANKCTNDTTFTVIVNPDAIAQFEPVLNYTSCAKYNVDSVIKVTAFPDRNATYTWNLKDKNGMVSQIFSNALPPNYELKTPGDSVEIYLVTTSKYGCQNDTSATIVFKAGNTIKAEFGKDLTGANGCDADTVKFNNISSALDNGITFRWNFGNGSTSQNAQPGNIIFPSGANNTDTTYFITLTASNACAIDTFNDSIKIKAKPLARFGVDTTFGCSPLILKINNTSLGNPMMYYWNLGDSFIFNTNNQNSFFHKFTSSTLDTFNIKLVAQNDCGLDSLFLPVVVAPNSIVPQVNAYGSDLFGCVPHTVTFNNNTTGAVSSMWDFDDGTATTLPGNIISLTHEYQDTGTYNVKIQFYNGCSRANVNQQIVVYSRPKAEFEILNNVNNNFMCFGDSTKINITAQTGDFNRLYWGDENFYYSPPVTSHLYKNRGFYKIRLYADRVNDFGIVCSDSSIKIVSIGSRPITKVTTSGVINCFNPSSQLLASGGVRYNWFPPQNLTNSHVANPKATPDFSTMYHVQIVGSSGCTVEDSVKVLVDYTQGSEQDFIPSAFTPNKDGLNDCIHVLKSTINGRPIEKLKFSIYNRWGEQVFVTENPNDCWDGKVKGKDQPSGAYVYMLQMKSVCTDDKLIFLKGTIVLVR